MEVIIWCRTTEHDPLPMLLKQPFTAENLTKYNERAKDFVQLWLNKNLSNEMLQNAAQ